MRIKKRTLEIVEVARPGDRASLAFDWFIISLIGLNIVVFIAESIEEVRSSAPLLFQYFEVVSVIVFSVEYVARLWSCTADPRFARPVRGRALKATRPMMLIDLLAIAPFYLPMVGLDLRVFRALRMFRLLRIAKLGRYTSSLGLIGEVIREKRQELWITLAFMLTLLLLASSLMYFAEREAQPEVFGSIPAAMWWAVATLTTVGYGDVYPVTAAGKMLASVIAVLGIGMFALPTGILGAGFVAVIERRKLRGSVCPTCGRPLPDESRGVVT